LLPVRPFLTKSPLRHATPARLVIPLPVAADSFLRDPQVPWVSFYLQTSLLRHGTAAWLDAFLPPTVNLFRNAQFPQVLSFGFWRRPTARCRSLCRLFSAPDDLTAALSLETSWCPHYGLHHSWVVRICLWSAVLSIHHRT
jgi:hypothetical protein